eukprot:CAMPEP_0206568436 /NCGR_PEP_ID=MMETSP0325_2-20121206/25833_1 /ASSEMBLY_ACC=CAM_ASM_000347 /TAXON_ID=2866 /ORGANISM="Crypthecodinium cohnii, Strain Seligo" /LENGTH=142 /DNA_ID=CAMNT_0054071817 /DNA_START=274 /DNA_END=699 /DNA_ORIENTATION=+
MSTRVMSTPIVAPLLCLSPLSKWTAKESTLLSSDLSSSFRWASGNGVTAATVAIEEIERGPDVRVPKNWSLYLVGDRAEDAVDDAGDAGELGGGYVWLCTVMYSPRQITSSVQQHQFIAAAHMWSYTDARIRWETGMEPESL